MKKTIKEARVWALTMALCLAFAGTVLTPVLAKEEPTLSWQATNTSDEVELLVRVPGTHTLFSLSWGNDLGEWLVGWKVLSFQGQDLTSYFSEYKRDYKSLGIQSEKTPDGFTVAVRVKLAPDQFPSELQLYNTVAVGSEELVWAGVIYYDASQEPSTEPSTEPTTEPSTQPSTEPQTEPSTQPSTEPQTEVEKPLKKGKVFVVKNLKYKVLDNKQRIAVVGTTSKSLKALVVPAKVNFGKFTYVPTSVGASAFKGSKKLASIKLAATVTSVGKSAFQNCKALKKLTFQAKSLKVGKSAFKGIYSKASVKVPKKKASSYRKSLKKGGIPLSVKIK